jgi:hypothetical protein
MPTAAPAADTLTAEAFAASDPVLLFLDRAILRERRMEALWKRAARGPFPEEVREALRFESYEDREHARILRRHRGTYVRSLGIQRRAPGSRASKVGRTLSAASAMAEALSLKAASRAEYTGMWSHIEDRFLRKFVQVLAGSEDRSLPALLETARHFGIRPKSPSPERAAQLRPVASSFRESHAFATSA